MRVIFTGGGTAGHILPNIAVISELRANASNFVPLYLGSRNGPERALCEQYGVPFRAISTGKLRRYFSLKNLIDPFRVMKGMWDAWRILREWRPDIVFSKGGFVSVPVVLAAAKLGVPVLLHEADVAPGLANRICARFAKVVCVSWEETMHLNSLEKSGRGKFFPPEKTLLTGMPVREDVVSGVREKGLEFLGFSGRRPVLLVIGGSLGAKSLNSLVLRNLNDLANVYDVAHVTGKDTALPAVKNNISASVQKHSGTTYRAFSYLNEELFDVYAAADVVISRAGASAIAELCVLAKPCVFIPLGSSASRGDQIVNAGILRDAGAAEMLLHGEFDDRAFVALLRELAHNDKRRNAPVEHMRPYGHMFRRAVTRVADVILKNV